MPKEEKCSQDLLTEITTKYITDDTAFIEWCKVYISLSPNILQNILDTIGDIILDNNRMEVVDIPNMVLLIISNVQKEAKQVCPDYIISLTKIIMYMIIDYELFIISPILQNNIVIEAMVNSCLELVKIELSQKQKQKSKTSDFWDWISNIFVWK